MKKISIAILSFAVLSIGFASCKSHETCPAYGPVSSTADVQKDLQANS